MSQPIRMSMTTRKNRLIDASVFLGGGSASLSGVYLLFLPSGGYQGGRNPACQLTILLSRQGWSQVRTWGGVLMIAAIVIHFAVHWNWVKMMGRCSANALRSDGTHLSKGANVNAGINASVGISFLVRALSGIYFLFAPAGGFQGGNYPGWDPMFLVSRTTWDMTHTWSGVVMIVTTAVHFTIHWRWVKNMTVCLLLSLRLKPAGRPGAVTPCESVSVMSDSGTLPALLTR